MQLIVTLVASDCSHSALLSTYEKRKEEWRRVLGPFPVVIGKSGITWDKKEGDGKTPAGAFPLLQVFGRREYQTESMTFLEVHETLEAIDDPASIYYNQIIDSKSVKLVDWNSSERMLEVGPLYDLGVVVGYNYPSSLPGKGSCIFLHIWRSAAEGTAGCTAMPQEVLHKIVSWLDEKKSPCIVQLPVQEACLLPVEVRNP